MKVLVRSLIFVKLRPCNFHSSPCSQNHNTTWSKYFRTKERYYSSVSQCSESDYSEKTPRDGNTPYRSFDGTDGFLQDREWLQHYKKLLNEIDRNGVNSLDARFIPVKDAKQKADHDKVQHFVDYRQIRTIGGNGGMGSISFMQDKTNARAGPDGGDGGDGGHVVFKAKSGMRGLSSFSTVIKASDGTKGTHADCHGKGADHQMIEVPIGTIFKHEGIDVASLDEPGDMFIAARGGAGGKGNPFFATSVEQTPRIAEHGGEGEELVYDIELRTIADIGLIGFPNAGKSTLLRAVSRAKPKVAAYPFTTLNPHVGMVNFRDLHQMAVADIPGLIEGAHKNKGLGFSFLRHIQRCSSLLFVLDASYPDPLNQLDVLRRELDHYSEGLSKRPHAVVFNKMDLAQSKINIAEIEDQVNIPVIPISAKMGGNLIPLLAVMRLLSNV